MELLDKEERKEEKKAKAIAHAIWEKNYYNNNNKFKCTERKDKNPNLAQI